MNVIVQLPEDFGALAVPVVLAPSGQIRPKLMHNLFPEGAESPGGPGAGADWGAELLLRFLPRPPHPPVRLLACPPPARLPQDSPPMMEPQEVETVFPVVHYPRLLR